MKLVKRIIGIVCILLCAMSVVFAKVHIPLDLKDDKKLPEWPVKVTSYGGTLLLSDSPEIVFQDGILYEDTVSGNTRLFFHHVNGTATKKKLVVLLTNPAKDKDVTVTVWRNGLGGAGTNYVEVGKNAQYKYLADSEVYILSAGPQKSVELSEDISHQVLAKDMLLNGIYDFSADGPIKVQVMMLPVEADPQVFAKTAQVLPPDEQRLRGTFSGKDRMIEPLAPYDPSQKILTAITLADNSKDKYLKGIDATNGSSVVNYGNYGVMYYILIPSSHSGNFTSLLNPRGGDYAGVLGVKYRHQKPYVLGMPRDRLAFGYNTVEDTEWIGDFASGQSLWLTFSPPGASNLPIKIIFLPQGS